MVTQPTAKLLDPVAAGRYLGVSRTTLFRWNQDGLIKRVIIKRPGTSRPMIRYEVAELERFANEMAEA